MLHIPPTNSLLLAAEQEPHKKAYILGWNEKYWRIFWKEFRRIDQQVEKRKKTDRVTGLGRRTREKIVKWNQMTALRIQTGGRHPDIPGLPSGAIKKGHHCNAAMLFLVTWHKGHPTINPVVRRWAQKEVICELHWKDKMLPFSVRPTQEFFHRQHWENFNKTGWSAGRFSWMHRHSGQKSRGTHHDHSSTLSRGCRSSHRLASSLAGALSPVNHRGVAYYTLLNCGTCHNHGTKSKRNAPRPQFHPLQGV